MLTYQDLQHASDKLEFVKRAINEHKTSTTYRDARIAVDYDMQKNRTIRQYVKFLRTLQGEKIIDAISANHKMASGFFHRFLAQQNQHLLGNGIRWGSEDTAKRLGPDFDIRLQELGHAALCQGVSFGFFNFDHLEVFRLTEFAPLYDEEDGALKAGVRFWQISEDKPLRATLYEIDGYTDYIYRKGVGSVYEDKRSYIQIVEKSAAEGVHIYNGRNYPSFPIVPLWGNKRHVSELYGRREQIDAYDLIKSGFANDLDDASQIYWILENAGGMDDIDLAEFIQRLHDVKAVTLEGNAKAEAHTLEVPHAARTAILDRIEADLYKDFMALDVDRISSGAATATEIKAAYEPLNSKCDEYEYCIHDFLDGILALIGIRDTATFTPSMVVNVQEEIQTVLLAAPSLSEDYVTRKILILLGDGDKAEEVLQQMDAEAGDRFGAA